MTIPTLVVEGRSGPRENQYMVVLEGKLTLFEVFRFQQAVQESQAHTTIVDLTNVSLVDSMGLGAIVQAHVHHQRANRRLALVGVNERVGKLLQISGLNPVLTIFATMDKAAEALA